MVEIDDGFTLRLAGGRPLRRGGCSSRPAPSTSCPTSPALASAGAATSSTARTATAGRFATSRSACSEPVPAPSTTRTCCGSGRTTSSSSRTPPRHRERAGGARRARHRRRRGPVARLSSSTIACDAVQLADGRAVPRAAVFIRPALHAHDDGLIDSLGCEVDDGGFVRVDATGRTSVPGVWAAGNASQPTRAGDHRRRRRIRCRHRDQHRPRRGGRPGRPARTAADPRRASTTRQEDSHDQHH